MAELSTSDSGGAFLHDAFISYSRKDSPFVAALERTLRSYRPPAGLALNRQRLNIFRDTEDFTGTEYFASLDRHLKVSRKLIIVCSPNARKSKFVDDEIRRFSLSRETKDIIPVLIAGIPNNESSAPDALDLAFPAALAERLKIPLACDYRGFDPKSDKWTSARKYEQAWFQLLANLFDRSRDEIDQRERRRQRQQRLTRLAVGGAVSAALLIAGGVALIEQQNARTAGAVADVQRETAEAERLGGQAMHQAGRDPIESLRLALSAADRRPTEQATSALRLALAKAPDVTILLRMRERKEKLDFVSPPKFQLSPDARTIALAEERPRIVDLTTGKTILEMKDVVPDAAEIRFSPGGELVAVVDERRDTVVFDARSGQATEKFVGELFWRTGAAEGPQAVVMRDKFLEIGVFDAAGRWTATRKVAPETYFDPKAGTGSFAQTLSPDGRKFVTLVNSNNAVNAKVTVTDLDTGRRSNKSYNNYFALAVSPKGSLLAIDNVDGATIIDSESLKPLFQTPKGMFDGLSFSDDDALLAMNARSEAVPVFALKKRAKIADLSGLSERVYGTAFAPANDYVGVRYTTTNRVHVYALNRSGKDIESEYLTEPVANFDSIWGGAADMRFTPDGRGLLLAYARGVLALWGADRWRTRARLPIGYDAQYDAGVPHGLNDIRLTADGKAIGVLKGGVWRGFDIETGAEFKDAANALRSLDEINLREHGEYALKADENDEATVHLVRRATSARQYPLSHFAPVMSMAFSPNGQCVLTSSRYFSAGGETPPSSSVARLWDTATGAMLQEWRFHFGSPDGALFAGNERVIALSDGEAQVFKTRLCRELDALRQLARERTPEARKPITPSRPPVP